MAKKDNPDRGILEKPKGSGKWWISYTDQFGHEHRQYVGTKPQARAARITRLAEVRAGRFAPKDAKRGATGVLFETAMREYLVDALPSQRSPEHTRLYAERWIEHFKNRALESIESREIQRWMTAQTNAGVKPATINRQLVPLKALMNQAVIDERLVRNPFHGLKRRRLSENNQRTRFLYAEEQTRLMEHIPPEWRPLILIAIGTGLRLTELVSLEWEHVNLAIMQITVHRTKNGEMRRIPIHFELADIFRALPSRLRSPWVFPSPLYPERHIVRDGTRKKVWDHAVKQAKIADLVWHDLRRTCASRLLMAGVPLEEIGEILGDKSLAMIRVYARLSPEHLQGTINKIPLGIAPQSHQTDQRISKGA